MNETHNRYRLRFTLKMLLVLMTLIAVSFGSYFVGHQNGRKEGIRTASDEWQANYKQILKHTAIERPK